MIANLEGELGDGPPCISPAAIDVAVRLRLTGFARQLERELRKLAAEYADLKVYRRETQSTQTHQSLADELNMDMSDNFTRVFVAALYWHDRAIYWRQKAMAPDS